MRQFVFSVSGMSCAMCENHINDAIRRTCNVKSVKSSRKKKETVVIADAPDIEAIKKALSALGYEAERKEEGEQEKQTFFQHLWG